MIPPSFEYHRPSTVEEAVGLLSSLGSEAKILAGDHSLLPMMKSVSRCPSILSTSTEYQN